MVKESYSFEEALNLTEILKNYNALIRWYGDKTYESLGDSEKEFILKEAIKEIKREKQGFKNLPESFDKEITQLDILLNNLKKELENYAQSSPKSTDLTSQALKMLQNVQINDILIHNLILP
jgi:hypothetical protein